MLYLLVVIFQIAIVLIVKVNKQGFINKFYGSKKVFPENNKCPLAWIRH